MSALRTISAEPPVAPLRMHGGEPVLLPDPSHPWESRVVLNPAAVLVTEPRELTALARSWGLADGQTDRLIAAGGACVLLYRAQGTYDDVRGVAPSSLGLAVLTPELSVVARRGEPVLGPDAPYQNFGVEDPRCTRVGDLYHLYYTGYAGATPDAGRVRICLATTRDFLEWDRHGPIPGDLNDVPNKNAALLPEPVDGQWILLHRPMEGPGAMAIHWARADRPAGPWRTEGLLMESFRYREFRQSWIGAGGPPLALGNGRFLMIYHQGHYTHDGRREYDLATALLDFHQESPVRARIEPLMRPRGLQEQADQPELGVDNVLFTCANYVFDGELVIPYAGADSRIFGASIPVEELLTALLRKSMKRTGRVDR